MKKPIGLVLLIVIALASCKKAQELAKYKDQATSLVTKFGPQLAELGKKLPELLARAKSLPPSLPGAAKVAKLLEDNKGSVEKLQGMLGELPKKVVTESPDEAKKTLDDAEKDLSTGVGAISSSVGDAEKQLTSLEAQGAAPAGSGSAAGT